MNNSSDFITLKTRSTAAAAKDCKNWLVWVPGHCTEGNEIADHLDNVGRYLWVPDNIMININDLFPLIKKLIWEFW